MIPPYVSYKTFRNFLEFLKETFPSRIDRSVWGPRYSGTSGQQLMTALKVLNLIDENGIPSNKLSLLVNSEGENRRNILKSILMKFRIRVLSCVVRRQQRGCLLLQL